MENAHHQQVPRLPDQSSVPVKHAFAMMIDKSHGQTLKLMHPYESAPHTACLCS